MGGVGGGGIVRNSIRQCRGTQLVDDVLSQTFTSPSAHGSGCMQSRSMRSRRELLGCRPSVCLVGKTRWSAESPCGAHNSTLPRGSTEEAIAFDIRESIYLWLCTSDDYTYVRSHNQRFKVEHFLGLFPCLKPRCSSQSVVAIPAQLFGRA